MEKSKKAGKPSKKEIRKEISRKLNSSLAEFIPVIGKKRIEYGIKKLSNTLSRRLKKSVITANKKKKEKPVNNVKSAPENNKELAKVS